MTTNGDGDRAPDDIDDLLARPGHLIRRLHQIAISIFLDEVDGQTLTPVQYAAMVAIRARPGIDQAELSRAIAFDRSTIGGVIDRLEHKGYVERRLSPSDRRTRQLFLKPHGADLLGRLASAVDRSQSRFLEPLSDDERQLLMDMLRRLVEANNTLSRSPVVGARAGSNGGESKTRPK